MILCILLDFGCISDILNGIMTQKLKYKPDTSTEWITQAGKFTAKSMANIYFNLTEFNATKIVTWKCHVDESTKGQYDVIIGRDLLITL